MTTFAKQFEDFADCCLGLARSAETPPRRERLIQMAHEYRLATLRVLQGELSSDKKGPQRAKLKCLAERNKTGSSWPGD